MGFLGFKSSAEKQAEAKAAADAAEQRRYYELAQQHQQAEKDKFAQLAKEAKESRPPPGQENGRTLERSIPPAPGAEDVIRQQRTIEARQIEAKNERHVETAKPVQNPDGTYRLEMKDEKGNTFAAGDKDGEYNYKTAEAAERAREAIQREAQARQRQHGGQDHGL